MTCAHPKIAMINYALAKGAAPLAVAHQYGIPQGSVYGHAHNHIEENYRKITASGVYHDIDELLKKCAAGDGESIDILNACISGTFNAWSIAFANGSQSGMTAHGSQLRQLIELRAKINRELAPATTYGSVVNNVLVTGDVSALLKILAPFPEARQAICDHFRTAPVIEHAAAD
jgi:hypothetical protein